MEITESHEKMKNVNETGKSEKKYRKKSDAIGWICCQQFRASSGGNIKK